MKHFSPFFLFSFFFLAASGQNLVPNPSFEEYSSCPTGEDEIQLSSGWSKYSESISTPDYYNACAQSSGFGVPQSLLLYQDENRGCSAYVGLVVWNSNGIREHIGAQLNEPLVIGQKYFISFKTVRGGGNLGGNYFEHASNNIGLKLSTVSFSESNPAPVDNFSHLRVTEVLTDTSTWYLVSGSITADSVYRYVSLGNFYDNLNTDTILFNCSGCLNQYSYYLIDDVCISTDSVVCNGETDGLPCNVSVEYVNPLEQVRIYPNPATEWAEVIYEGMADDSEISIYDMTGRLLHEQRLIEEKTRIDLSQIEISGLLIVNVSSNNYSSNLKLLKL